MAHDGEPHPPRRGPRVRQIVVCFVWLAVLIGPSFLAGLLTMMLSVPCQALVLKTYFKCQARAARRPATAAARSSCAPRRSTIAAFSTDKPTPLTSLGAS